MWTRGEVRRALATLDLPRDPEHLLALVFLSACGRYVWIPMVGSEVLSAKLFQLPGVFFTFKDPKDLEFGFIFYSVIPKELCRPWGTLWWKPMPSVKCQKRSQAIIFILWLCLPSPRFSGGKLNQPPVNFTSISFTSHSCKRPCTSPLPFFLEGKGHNYLANRIPTSIWKII